MKCSCGSYAINHHLHGRDGSDGHLCDVCYWIKRANATTHLLAALEGLLAEYEDRKSQWGDEYLWDKHENKEVIESARIAIAKANEPLP